MKASTFIFLVVVAVVAVLTPIFTIYGVFSPNEEKKLWSGVSAEGEECMKYGGAWGGTKGEDPTCIRGNGIPINDDGTCPEGYTKIEISYPYSKYDGYYGCMKEEYVNSAKCEKYWELKWSIQGYGCHRLDQDQINSIKMDEILENQKKILESLD